MNESDIASLKTHIRQRICELERMLSSAESVVSKPAEVADDQSASLDVTIGASVDTQLLAAARRELISLNQNLIWLESEDAGWCESCGNEIPVARLRAVPTTRFCVQCAD